MSLPIASPPRRPDDNPLAQKARAALEELKKRPDSDKAHRFLYGRLEVWDGEPPPDRIVPDSMMGR